jgi:hypothetical protein
VNIRREGTDGSFDRMLDRYAELDGTVDAFGLGGATFALKAGGREYPFREMKKVRQYAKRTPVLDGNGLRDTLERDAVRRLQEETGEPLSGKTVLLTDGVDRVGLAEGFREHGCDLIYGDLIFGIDIPFPIRSDATFRRVAKTLCPIMVQLPLKVLYPTGSDQEKESSSRFERYYEESRIVAGDYLFVRKYMPQDMTGKWIVANTTTESDIEDLRGRGVELLVTTTPRLGGRSFGTNVMEAVLVAIAGSDGPLSRDEYTDLLERTGIESEFHWLQKSAAPSSAPAAHLVAAP